MNIIDPNEITIALYSISNNYFHFIDLSNCLKCIATKTYCITTCLAK